MCVHLPFNQEKATQALNFFAQKEGGAINKTKALKLVFLADRYHLRKYGRPITNDKYLAMKLGPVGSTTKDIAEVNDYLDPGQREYVAQFITVIDSNCFKSIEEIDYKVFSKSDIEALEFAWNEFGHFQWNDLAEYTHDYPEWKKHEKELKIFPKVPMDYENFFEDPPKKINDCFSLNDEEKTNRQSQLKELAYLESLWD